MANKLLCKYVLNIAWGILILSNLFFIRNLDLNGHSVLLLDESSNPSQMTIKTFLEPNHEFS